MHCYAVKKISLQLFAILDIGELACVGAVLGGGFNNTLELHIDEIS